MWSDCFVKRIEIFLSMDVVYTKFTYVGISTAKSNIRCNSYQNIVYTTVCYVGVELSQHFDVLYTAISVASLIVFIILKW